ncbi:MAG: beta-propeller domain-containing protein [Deltaproteobacteria bacterium]|nr:beta-propeller domain-containing protein [Deltaproteobacteria bacterium]
MRRSFAQLVMPAVLLALAACTGGGGGSTSGGSSSSGVRPHGQSSFETPMGSANNYNRGGASEGSTSGGGAPAAGDSNQAGGATGGGAAPRAVEESDIYKLDGNTLFVLNRYRGLQILDVTDLDHPRVIGRAPIYGYPKDMYVRGQNAYIIVSDYYSFWREDTAMVDGPWYASWGSQLRIVDISNPASPTVTGSINLQGDCGDSRIVGDVMYLVSHRYPWWGGYATDDTEDKTQVLSLDLTDQDNIHVVDTADFARNGWEHHISVTENTIYLASSQWQYDDPVNYTGGGYVTNVRYVDISDPAGDIKVRDDINVAGRVMDRWSMDEYQGHLRVASSDNWGNGDVFLTTVNVQNPDSLLEAGRYTLRVNEQLTSARFDGAKGYLVSFRRIDPLFAFDLSDPVNPRLLGELQMEGWLDFMVPMGDRIVALGHDDVTHPDGSTTWALAVSLIDTTPTTPVLLSRVIIDGAYGWIPSERDDFAKVFRVLPELGLIVFPFQAWDPQDWRYIGGVQLVDVSQTALTKRGLIGNAGWVERGIPFGQSTVLTLSSEVFQVMDITDRDNPSLRGRLELARNVTDFALIGDGTYNVQLAGDWYLGDTQLAITPTNDPDTASPVASLHVPAPYGRVFHNGDMVYVSSVQQDPNGGNARSVVKTVDLSDPTHPRVRGSVELPTVVYGSYGYWYWGSGDEVIQVDGSLLVFHRYSYRYWYGDCYNCGPSGYTPEPDRIYVVDMADPDAPRLASTVELTDIQWAWGLRASGRNVYLSDYTSYERDGYWWARYNLLPISLADANNPVLGDRINIPGYVVGLEGDKVFTVEGYYNSDYSQYTSWLHALQIFEGAAYLQSSVQLPGYAYNVAIEGNGAYTATNNYTQVTVNDMTQYIYRTTLTSIDISDIGNIHVAGTADVPTDWGYLRKVEGGRAFLGGGAGLFVFDVRNLEAPRFESFFRTWGWVVDIVTHGNKAFLPSGYYGVQVLDLEAQNNPI